MRDTYYPLVACGLAFDKTGTTVRHPNTPFPLITAIIRQVHTVHHIVFMAVDILITQTTDIVYLGHGRRTILVTASIPRVLVNRAVHYGIRDLVVYFIRFIITDRILHPINGCTARGTVIRMLTASALFLAVTTAISRIKQVRYTRVHHSVYLLHATLLAVKMKVDPVHIRRRGISCYTGTKLASDHAAAHHGTKMFLVGHPVGFHVLNLVAVT